MSSGSQSGPRFTDHLGISSGGRDDATSALAKFFERCGESEAAFSDEVWVKGDEGEWARRYCIVAGKGLYLLPQRDKSGGEGERVLLEYITDISLPEGEGVRCVVSITATLPHPSPPRRYSILFSEKVRAHEMCLTVTPSAPSATVIEPSPLPPSSPLSPVYLPPPTPPTPQHVTGIFTRPIAPLPSTVQAVWRPVEMP